MNRRVLVWVLTIAVVLSPGFVFAGYEGDVLIGGEVVLRIRFPAGGMSVKERADAVTARINEYLGSTGFDPSAVRVGTRNGEAVVLIGDNLVITADRKTAEFNKATPEQLAKMWAENLRRVIPKAKAEPTE